MIRPAAALTALIALAPLAASAQSPDPGVYQTNCAACHQASGIGVKGAFPALAGDTVVKGDPEPVITMVLRGHGAMPSFAADLSDAEIASAVSYIRSAWGNGAAPITPAAVAAVRAHTQGSASAHP